MDAQQGDQTQKIEKAKLAQKHAKYQQKKAKSPKLYKQASENKKLLQSLYTKSEVLIKKLHCILYAAAGCLFVDNICPESEQHVLRYKQVFAAVALQQHVCSNSNNSF